MNTTKDILLRNFSHIPYFYKLMECVDLPINKVTIVEVMVYLILIEGYEVDEILLGEGQIIDSKTHEYLKTLNYYTDDLWKVCNILNNENVDLKDEMLKEFKMQDIVLEDIKIESDGEYHNIDLIFKDIKSNKLYRVQGYSNSYSFNFSEKIVEVKPKEIKTIVYESVEI